ncbi:MAG TPA: sulfotransferase domain-containing protein [Gammaproteobacteria bacterium]|nr:sulfotransferase domain-containing protein [Gammaproteobacteria bacterium]
MSKQPRARKKTPARKAKPAPKKTAARAPADEPPRGPGWIDVDIQRRVKWRDGDIVVSVPVKSGTTWTMNIVHQLREGGDPDFEDLYVEVPWLELVPGPSVTREQRLAKLERMPRGRRRAFKTHSPPGPLPYRAPGASPDVRYVVVVRNPDEVLASMHPFVAAHSDAWFELWHTPREVFVRPDFHSFYYDVAQQAFAPMIFGFVAAWWPLRGRPNVLLLHFADMKRDHDGSVRTIAEFLGLRPRPEQWPAILEYTSFGWMKANERKFEIQTAAEVPILDSGAMVRKGKVGAAHEDGVTPAISADTARLGREILTDAAAFEWCYRGGPLPD